MQRHNLFDQHHKALKAMLYDAALNLQQTNISTSGEASRITKKLTDVIQLNDELMQHEAAFIFNAIDAYEPAIVDALKRDLSHALTLSQKWHKIAGSIDYTASRVFLPMAFMDYRDFHICLMAKKQSVVNPVLWHYYTDRDLRNLEQEMISTLSEEQQQLISSWRSKLDSNDKAVYGAGKVEDRTTELQFRQIVSTAESELYHTVQAGNGVA